MHQRHDSGAVAGGAVGRLPHSNLPPVATGDLKRHQMKRLIRRLRLGLFHLMVRRGFLWPIVLLCARDVSVVPGRMAAKRGQRLPTILALNPTRFRSDLEILAATGEFRVLKAPLVWQKRFLSAFYPKGANPLLAGRSPETLTAQCATRAFLQRFLRLLYLRLGVDCVLGAAVHYMQDVDWGAASDRIGVPYVVLHREGLYASPAHRQRMLDRGREYGRFVGSHMIVQNRIVKDVWTESGFVRPEQVDCFGALRMDAYLRSVTQARGPGSRKRKRVAFFSFGRGTSLAAKGLSIWPADPEAGLVNLFRNSHVAFGELARDHPEIDFVFKPKWGGTWIGQIDRVLGEAGIDARSLSNLVIDPDLNAQALILSSDVVVGFGSTTLLEAAIAGKPVVVPFHDEARDEAYEDYILLRAELDIFDVARSPEQLKELVLARLDNPEIESDVAAARKVVFERYISSLDGTATEKFVACLKAIIGRRQRSDSAHRSERREAL